MGCEDHSEHCRRQDNRDLEASTPSQIDGVVIGALVALDESGQPRVAFPGNPKLEAIPARSTAVLTREHLGKQVALLFEGGDPKQPIVIGLVQRSGREADAVTRLEVAPVAAPQEVELDGKKVELTARETITLRCGDASITLNKDGKIVIRGTHVVSHAAGVNRIRGGSVQLN